MTTQYIIERSTTSGMNIRYWYKALGSPWTAIRGKAEPMTQNEAEQFCEDLRDHAASKGNGYKFNILPVHVPAEKRSIETAHDANQFLNGLWNIKPAHAGFHYTAEEVQKMRIRDRIALSQDIIQQINETEAAKRGTVETIDNSDKPKMDLTQSHAEAAKFHIGFAVAMINCGRESEATDAFKKAYDQLDKIIEKEGAA